MIGTGLRPPAVLPNSTGSPNRSASRATATGGADDTVSGTNPSHGSVHNATASPSRSSGPRPRPGSTNATSAGVSVKYRNNSSRLISGNPRSRSSSSSANTLVATNPDLQPAPTDSQPRNLPSHIRPIFGGYYGDPCLPEPAASAMDDAVADDPTDLAVLQWPDTVRVEHTRQRYQRTHDLREQGLSMRAIARRLDLNFKTVRRYLRAGSVDSLLAGGVQVSVLDPFKPYLNGRLAQGERNATRVADGDHRAGLHRWLQHPGPVPTPAAPYRRSHTRGPAVASGAACGAEGHRLDHRPPEQPRAGRFWAAARVPRPLPRAGRRRPARRRVRPDDQRPVRRPEHAHQWIGAVDADLPPLRSFTAGLRRDLDAVVAGLTLQYNSGAVEGTVNRIKQLKTAMYGRAKPDLLRKRTPGLNTAPDSETTRPPPVKHAT